MPRGSDDQDVLYGIEIDRFGAWVAWAKRRGESERWECVTMTRWGAGWKARKLARMIRGEFQREL